MSDHHPVPLVVLIVALAACTEGERTLPRPTFEGRAAVPDLVTGGGPSGENRTSSFEESIRESMSDDDGASDETSSRQLVPVGSDFAGEIPVEFDAWRWSTSGRATLVVHAETGGTPDAILYAEDFSEIGEPFPSLEISRFLVTADSRWRGSTTVPQTLVDGLAELAANFEGSADTMLGTLLGSTSSTFGTGLRYRSRDETFSGWRWVGRNGQGVTVRASRTRGRFGIRGGLDDGARRNLEKLSSSMEGMEEVEKALDEIPAPTEAGGGDAASAGAGWMVLGQIQKRGLRPCHYAVACRSPCPVGSQLARFLDSFRPRSEVQGRIATPTVDDIETLGRDHGIPYVRPERLPGLGRTLKRLQEGLDDPSEAKSRPSDNPSR